MTRPRSLADPVRPARADTYAALIQRRDEAVALQEQVQATMAVFQSQSAQEYLDQVQAFAAKANAMSGDAGAAASDAGDALARLGVDADLDVSRLASGLDSIQQVYAALPQPASQVGGPSAPRCGGAAPGGCGAAATTLWQRHGATCTQVVDWPRQLLNTTLQKAEDGMAGVRKEIQNALDQVRPWACLLLRACARNAGRGVWSHAGATATMSPRPHAGAVPRRQLPRPPRRPGAAEAGAGGPVVQALDLRLQRACTSPVLRRSTVGAALPACSPVGSNNWRAASQGMMAGYGAVIFLLLLLMVVVVLRCPAGVVVTTCVLLLGLVLWLLVAMCTMAGMVILRDGCQQAELIIMRQVSAAACFAFLPRASSSTIELWTCCSTIELLDVLGVQVSEHTVAVALADYYLFKTGGSLKDVLRLTAVVDVDKVGRSLSMAAGAASA